MTVPVNVLNAASNLVSSGRSQPPFVVSAQAGFAARPVFVRSRAAIWLFSSTHNTTTLSGGFRYSPTTSVTLATNARSADNNPNDVAPRGRNPVRVPDALDRRVTHAGRLGHRTTTPAGGTRRRVPQSGLQDGLYLTRGDLRLPSAAGAYLAHRIQSIGPKP